MGNIHRTFLFCNDKSKKLNWKLTSTPSRIIDPQLSIQHSCLFDSRLGPPPPPSDPLAVKKALELERQFLVNKALLYVDAVYNYDVLLVSLQHRF
jgi:hypothetical protein